MKSRNGKHRIGKSSIGIYADSDFRALLILLVDITGETATDLIMDGVRRRATALGVLHEGKVVEKYRVAIKIIKEALAKKGKKKGGSDEKVQR